MHNQARAPGFVVGLLLAATASSTAQPPKLTSLDATGYKRVLATAKGKVVLVNFWATWCGPCRTEMPDLVKLESSLMPKGFGMTTVSTDDPEQATDALEFLNRHGVRMPAYILRAEGGDEFISSVDADWKGALPALFLYDRTGRKVKSWVGETAIEEIEAAIVKLLSERTTAPGSKSPQKHKAGAAPKADPL